MHGSVADPQLAYIEVTWTIATVQVLSLPSKRLGFFAPAGGALIARSDSNGEDLEAFAGAGESDSHSVIYTFLVIRL